MSLPALLIFFVCFSVQVASSCMPLELLSHIKAPLDLSNEEYEIFEGYSLIYTEFQIKDNQGKKHVVILHPYLYNQDKKEADNILEGLENAKDISGFQRLESCYIHNGRIIAIFEYLHRDGQRFYQQFGRLSPKNRSDLFIQLTTSFQQLIGRGILHKFMWVNSLAFATNTLSSIKLKTGFNLEYKTFSQAQTKKEREKEELVWQLKAMANIYNLELLIFQMADLKFMRLRGLYLDDLPPNSKILKKEVYKAFNNLKKSIKKFLKREPRAAQTAFRAWAKPHKGLTLLDRIKTDLSLYAGNLYKVYRKPSLVANDQEEIEAAF